MAKRKRTKGKQWCT